MTKKIISSLLLVLFIGFSMQVVHAQRGIDPSLKPDNAPDMPETGLTKEECIKKYQNDPGFMYVDPKTGEYKSDDNLEDKVWDKNTQMCLGEGSAPINAFLQILAGALLMLSGGIAVIVIAVGGVMYITSRGNQQQMEYAKNTLVYGILGSVVVIFSYFIVQYVLELVVG